jgi:two-component system phosphate regulon response regulator OmpR
MRGNYGDPICPSARRRQQHTDHQVCESERLARCAGHGPDADGIKALAAAADELQVVRPDNAFSTTYRRVPRTAHPFITMTTRLLLVNDDSEMRELLGAYLKNKGIEVSVLSDADSLETKLECDRPDIVVLDVLMPGVDGLTALARLREAGNDIPIIMLAARNDEVDRIMGLEMGADDYIGKPFNPRELLARVKAILRRCDALSLTSMPEHREPFRFGGYRFDFQSRTLKKGEQLIKLSTGEFALLNIFVNHPLRTLTRDHLIGLMHGPEGGHSERGMDVCVWRLRKILEADSSAPRLIQTVRGRGYVFVPDAEEFV